MCNCNSLQTIAVSSNNSSNSVCQRCINDTLVNYIGRNCSCEFSIGNSLIKRSGVLSEIGRNYIRLVSTNNLSSSLICNTDNLVFVKIE